MVVWHAMHGLNIMKMGAASGLCVALLVVVSLSCGLVLGASYSSGWRLDGHITFYGSPNGAGTQGGACGYQDTYALGYGSMTAALSTALFQGGAACGGCYELRCIPPSTGKNYCYSYSKSIIVTATNLCPPGSIGGWCNPPRPHFDLPMPAFLTLAQEVGGVSPVAYRRVDCVRRGGVRFTMGGNPYFLMVLIHNVGGFGDVSSVKIKGPSTGWIPMYRNWGSLWTVQTKIDGALSFLITLSDGSTVTCANTVQANYKFGQTWESRNNF